MCDDTVLAFGASEQFPRSAKVFPITADLEKFSSAHSLQEISDQPVWFAGQQRWLQKFLRYDRNDLGG